MKLTEKKELTKELLKEYRKELKENQLEYDKYIKYTNCWSETNFSTLNEIYLNKLFYYTFFSRVLKFKNIRSKIKLTKALIEIIKK